MTTQSLYDLARSFESKKMESDALYNAFMNKDPSELNKMIQEIVDVTTQKYPDMSSRFKEMADLTLRDKSRIAKHGFLLFGLYLTPEYAKTLVTPVPKVNPHKFQVFYATILPKLCQQHLNGQFTSLQEFVEYARPAYITM
jgi:hypothetical protein